MKKVIGIIFALLLIFGWVYYLSYELSKIANEEAINLKIGYIPIADCAQLYVAQDKGFFKEEGLDVELLKLAGGAKILAALAGGSVDIGFSNVVSLILANNAGLDFKAITGGPRVDKNHKETGLLVLKNSAINKIKDLEGTTIAVNTKKNIVELLLLEYLKKHEVDVNSIKLVEIPFPKMHQVIVSKQVDAISSIEPFFTFSLNTGKTKLLGDYFTEVIPEMEISTYNSSLKWINNNPQTIEKFKRALKKATEFANNNRSELIQIIANNTGLNNEQIQSISLPYYGYEIDVLSLSYISELVNKNGWIDKPTEIKDLILW